MNSTNGWALKHGRNVTKTLLLALLVFLGLGAKEARANVYNLITITNTTSATLTLASSSNTATDPMGLYPSHTYSSEYWITTAPSGDAGPVCSGAPPATIPPAGTPNNGNIVCFYTEARDVFLNELNGDGGSVTYNITPAIVDVSVPPLSVTYAWSTPWGSQGFQSILYPNGWWANGAVIAGIESGNQTNYTEYGFTAGGSDPGGQSIQFSLSGELMTATLQSTVGTAGMKASIGGTGFNAGTQVLFNGVASSSVSCTSTLCTAVVPDVGSVQSGDVSVTMLGLAGNEIGAGSYYELSSGPQCNYTATAATQQYAGTPATISATCAQKTDPVIIYEASGSSWNIVGVYYPPGGVYPSIGSSVLATVTLVACTQGATPGENGCDAATAFTVPIKVTRIGPG